MKETARYITQKNKINVDGTSLEFEANLPSNRVKPDRMLPVFGQMTNIFTDMGTYLVNNEGKEISCKAGCGACCRQFVPVSEAEAYQLAELVEELPEPKRSEIKERFENAHEHFSEAGWLGKLDKLDMNSAENVIAVVRDYFKEGVACPFLENESCSIHEKRPLACREYLVTSPASNCAEFEPEKIEKVPIPTKASATLCGMTRSINAHPAINGIPLILSLFWAERFENELEEKTGKTWMNEFIEKLPNVEFS